MTTLTTAALTAAIDTLPGTLPRDERRAAVAALEAQWAQWLHDEYAPSFYAPRASLIFERAWSDAHADGYKAVENAYAELVEFVTRVIAAD